MVKKASVKSSATKSVKKASVKKATTKKVAKKAATPAKEKEDRGIGKAQLRVLKALKSGAALTGSALAEKADIDPTMVGNQVGYRNPEINERPVHAGNLFNRGLVKIETDQSGEGRSKTVYSITAAGKKALESATR